MRARFQMNRATPQMRSIAKHLMVYEAAKNKSSEAKNPAAFHVTDKLRPHMATLMGIGGFRALLSRALVLANGEVSWLHAMRVNADATLGGLEAIQGQLGAAEFLEGRVVLLAHVLGLLVAFVGPELTSRLVGDILPQIPLDDLDFGNGG
jgi:hypothetical protein